MKTIKTSISLSPNVARAAKALVERGDYKSVSALVESSLRLDPDIQELLRGLENE